MDDLRLVVEALRYNRHLTVNFEYAVIQEKDGTILGIYFPIHRIPESLYVNPVSRHKHYALDPKPPEQDHP